MALVEVFTSSDEIEIGFIKDLLDRNDILYMVKNEHIQNMLGGIKPFTGVDSISGPIRVYVDERDIDNCKRIIEDNSIAEENTEEKVEERIQQHSEEIIRETEKIRTIYVAYVLTGMSFLILPYFINLYVLYKLKSTNKRAAGSLLIVSTILVILSLIFVVRAII